MAAPDMQPSDMLWIRRKDTRSSLLDHLVPSLKTSLDFLGVLFPLVVFVRASILVSFIRPLFGYLFMGSYLLLICSFYYILRGGGKKAIFLPGMLVAVAVFASCLFSPLRATAVAKGLGWLILFITLGPVGSGYAFQRFRANAWVCCRLLIIFVGIASAFWYFLRLPAYGVGTFMGVMTYSQTTGPLAAMACLFAFFQALRQRSYKWALLGVLCLVPTLAAGSRVAFLALIAGLLAITMLVRRFRIIGFIAFPVFMLYMIAGPRSDQPVDEQSTLSKMTETMRNKGTQNSRAELWDARMNEFKTFPFLGIGVGIGVGAGVALQDGSINVEPGSSYLAVLSMTGTIGALAFLTLFVTLIVRYCKNKSQIPAIDRLEIIAILVFYAVHAAAEGWILAVGSILALIFWLAVGRFYDFSVAGSES